MGSLRGLALLGGLDPVPGESIHTSDGRGVRVPVIYRGREGMIAWALHRISGLGVLFFLILHIADTALVLAGPEWYNRIVVLYHAPVIRVLEVALAAAVLYHALNGVRVIIVDFWPQATTVHRQLAWAVGVVFVVVFIPTAYVMLRSLLL